MMYHLPIQLLDIGKVACQAIALPLSCIYYNSILSICQPLFDYLSIFLIILEYAKLILDYYNTICYTYN